MFTHSTGFQVLFELTFQTVGVYVHYLEHDIDLFSKWVSVDQGKLQRNCVGVEEGAGLLQQNTVRMELVHYIMLLCQIWQHNMICSTFCPLIVPECAS